MQKILPGQTHALYSVAQTRQIEALAAQRLPPHALMQRAGLALAKLALAVAPHAQRIWLACGPGNNGGDGLEAAVHLQRWGKHPLVSWLGQPGRAPVDALQAYQRLRQQGISLEEEAPTDVDLCIDAMLGIGAQTREPTGRLARWMAHINASAATVLSVDVPSGLSADTGRASTLHVQADHTLALLTLKPGLFMGQGRDAASTVWFDALDVEVGDDLALQPVAQLPLPPTARHRPHASHKGSFGDVAVVGGAAGLVGAALLAARAALNAGAGRVFVALLDGASPSVDSTRPELMFRRLEALDLSGKVTVFGCGAGTLTRPLIEQVLSATAPVVIDADALNSIAMSVDMQTTLTHRAARGAATVLTPHPLEAARLLHCTAADVQTDRLAAARTLCERFACTIVLKGSGTVIAAPGQTTVINPTGCAALASAGTGDVLAGMIGAGLAQSDSAFQASCRAVYRHGAIADAWPAGKPLTAGLLADTIN